MKTQRLWLILFIIGLLPFQALSAQEELTQVVELTNGYTVAFPEDWQVEDDKDNFVLRFWNPGGTAGGWVYDPFQLASVVPISASLDLEGAFETVYNALLDRERLPADAVQPAQVGAYPAVYARYEYEDGDELFDEISYLIEFEEDTYGLMTLWGYPNSLELQEPQFLEIMETFLPPGATVSAEATPEASGAACFVSTANANTVQLRVGPGYNRASVLFLPAGEDFTVIGTNTTDEGDEWFQLDKDQVAPDSAANELWVLREDVDETGDCDNVGSAAAPPIVPISAQPPPADTSGDTTAPPSDSGGYIRPMPGDWAATYALEADASCIGIENVDFLITDIGLSQQFTAYMIVSSDGNAITFGGVNMARTAGTNTFSGLASYADGTSSQLFLTLTSPTSLSGSETFNFTISGTPCSGTFTLSAHLG